MQKRRSRLVGTALQRDDRMDQDLLRFSLAAFITLLVVVDPPGVVPIFVALTKDEQPKQRRKILIRAVLIAFGVALLILGHGFSTQRRSA